MRGKSIRIYNIDFGSFLKWNIYISTTIGILFGIMMLFMSLVGGNVYVNLGQIHYQGIIAGIIGLFLSPLLMAIFGVLIGLILFLPIKVALKLTKGIKLNGLFESPEIEATSDDFFKDDNENIDMLKNNEENDRTQDGTPSSTVL